MSATVLSWPQQRARSTHELLQRVRVKDPRSWTFKRIRSLGVVRTILGSPVALSSIAQPSVLAPYASLQRENEAEDPWSLSGPIPGR